MKAKTKIALSAGGALLAVAGLSTVLLQTFPRNGMRYGERADPESPYTLTLDSGVRATSFDAGGEGTSYDPYTQWKLYENAIDGVTGINVKFSPGSLKVQYTWRDDFKATGTYFGDLALTSGVTLELTGIHPSYFKIVIPINITYIDFYAFDNCHPDLVLYYLGGTIAEWDAMGHANAYDSKVALYSENRPESIETQRYWHYDNSGNPVLWTEED